MYKKVVCIKVLCIEEILCINWYEKIRSMGNLGGLLRCNFLVEF